MSDRIQELLDSMSFVDDPDEALRLSRELRIAIRDRREQRRQPFTLNQRAHLLSAELGVMPKDALDQLQGQQS